MAITYKVKTQKKQQKNLLCGKCGAATEHKVFTVLAEHGANDENEYHTEYMVVQCKVCKEINFCKTETNRDDMEEGADGEIVYPETITRFPVVSVIPKKVMAAGIPRPIYHIYNETYSALCNSFGILTAIGVRTLIEIICKDKNTKGKDLSLKINDLVKEGYLSERNAKYLHGLRIMGNYSAHEAKTYTETQLRLAFDIVEHLIETVYVIPSKAEMLRNAQNNIKG